MADRRKDPRTQLKHYQERRRKAALEQQAAARSTVLDARRSAAGLAQPAQQEEHPSLAFPPHPPSSEQPQSPQQTTRELWAAQLMHPEWMLDVPADLSSDWYVMPRPEGRRCIVVASQGQTAARLRNGVLMERFLSALPAGGAGSRSSDECVLDCIYHPDNETYYILDVLCWRGHELHDCTTEFRLFWLHSKLGEDVGKQPHHHHQPADTSAELHRTFVGLPAYPATPEGIRAAYADAVPFVRDGVYFIHRRTQYSQGQTPLALTWKDAASSRYAIDTDAAGTVQPVQQVVLQYLGGENRAVATADDPPITLAMLPASFVAQMQGAAKLLAGRLLRFELGPGGVAFSAEGQPVGAELKFLGAVNQRRGRADMLSKIMFQSMARTHPLTIEVLLEAAARSAAAEGAAVAGAAYRAGATTQESVASIGVETGKKEGEGSGKEAAMTDD